MGSVTLLSDLHPLNAAEPIDLTLEGMVMVVRFTQFSNALEPIEVNSVVGREIFVSAVQFANT